MTIAQHWPRFAQTVRSNSPRMPRIRPNAGEQARRTVANRTGAFNAAADGLGSGAGRAGGAVAVFTNAATGDAAGAANSILDIAISEGAAAATVAEAGPFVGQLIGILRGTWQALDRSDQMLRYLIGISAYIDGLSRLTEEAVYSQHNHTRSLGNEIPPYIMRQGDLFSRHRRRWWIEGMRRTDRVIAAMDQVRSTDRNEPRYSKQMFMEVFNRSRVTSTERNAIRRGAQDYLTKKVLRININEQRTALRRWANS